MNPPDSRGVLLFTTLYMQLWPFLLFLYRLFLRASAAYLVRVARNIKRVHGRYGIKWNSERWFVLLTFEGLKPQDIRAEPESPYGLGAVAGPTLKKRWRRFHQGRTDLFWQYVVRKAFPEWSWSGNWVHACSKAVQFVQGSLPQCPDLKDDVLADPSRHVNLKNVHLGWVPRALSVTQKSERVSNSKLLLTAPMEHKPADFESVITDDISHRIKHKMTKKTAWFWSFGQLTESVVFFMFRNGRTIQHFPLNNVICMLSHFPKNKSSAEWPRDWDLLIVLSASFTAALEWLSSWS
jgi:hypothetical protein